MRIVKTFSDPFGYATAGCRSISQWNSIWVIEAHKVVTLKLLHGLVTTGLVNNTSGIKQSSERQEECYLARVEHDDASGEDLYDMQSLTWCKIATVEGLSPHSVLQRSGMANQQKKANTTLDKPGTRRDREVKHGCKSSTNSETGRSKQKFLGTANTPI